MSIPSRGHLFVAVLVLLSANCGGDESRTAERPTEPASPAAVAGIWTRELPNRESLRLSLFASGIMAFQHVGEKLPISRAYGRWSYADGALELEVVASEPEGTSFPMANRLAVTIAPDKGVLELEGGGERAIWTEVSSPYGTSPGAIDRAAKNESNWSFLVNRAGQKAGAK